MSAEYVPMAFVLTNVTRRASEGRRMVALGFDVPRRGVILTGIGLGASIFPVLFLWPFLSTLSVGVIPFCIGFVFFLFEYRMRGGLGLKAWQHFRDRQRFGMTKAAIREGRVWICSSRIDPLADPVFVTGPASIPLDLPAEDPIEALGITDLNEGRAHG